MQVIERYFPLMSGEQRGQMEALYELYSEWNSKINVISKRDIENLYLHHVLHSLAIAKLFSFESGMRVADVGCGGGFPGIPLAILFPQTHFTLIDSVGKKLKVARSVADSIQLNNVEVRHERAEDDRDRYNYVVSRAAMDFDSLFEISSKLVRPSAKGDTSPGGVICLKGGDLEKELARHKSRVVITPIPLFFPEPFFEGKVVVYCPIK